MPARDTLRARLTRHWNNDMGSVNRGEKSEEWPQNMKQTKDGRNFLYFDSANNDFFGPPLQPGFIRPSTPPRVMIFNLFRLLQVNRHWAMDGKFFAAPKWFKQIYVVGFYAANQDSTSSFFPCVYILLQSKTEDAYREAFSKVFAHFFNYQYPTSLIMDFKTAARNTCLSLFPDVSIKHCLFHLFQSLYKRAQKEKIKSLWTILDEVDDGFETKTTYVGGRSFHPIRSVISTVGNYVRRPNGNSALYPATLWNMHERALTGLPRTNNGIENWNGQFNGYFSHNDIWLTDVIIKLQTDEEKVRQKIEMRIHNPLAPVTGGMRSKKAIYCVGQIKQLAINYANGEGQPRMEFLVSIGAMLRIIKSLNRN